ncbi:A/G-specific adenine glycosylase [Salinibius halmophilus]|uniref:A/G-specific adenine glycosylase n=1 Tax=Salinibius halmophilus TaxID=1853216 RepID=UPI001F22533E|nr:A/G-specific adenine glycosylase [Salinibius halmophilus]
MSSFSQRIIDWHLAHGRHNLPWQHDKSPYRVWVSEIMLQQTQVATVIPYYERFMQRFPNVHSLAEAEQDEVLALWTGLGYYARGRNLHKCAQILVTEHGGEFPPTLDEVIALPGIGRSTAAAILSISRNYPAVIMDGNVKRVLARHIGETRYPGERQAEKDLWQAAEERIPQEPEASANNLYGIYTQAMMDMGAMICTRNKPLCNDCPVASDCTALAKGLTAELPTRKPKKEKPVRQCVMLILRDEQGKLYLQQQPSSGLWGGLYIFPRFDDINSAWHWLDKQPLQASGEPETWSDFRHTFTHFHLDITPVLQPVVNSGIAEQGGAWVKAHERSIGLARPTEKLLNKLTLL